MSTEQLIQLILDAFTGGDQRRKTREVEKIMAKYLHDQQAKMGWGATAVTWSRENILDHPGTAEAAARFPESPVWLKMTTRSEYIFACANDGVPEDKTLEEVEAIEQMIAEHTLPFYGYSFFQIENPPVCKVSAWACWPIPKTIFEDAQAVDFIPDRFNQDVQYHLTIAHLAYRTHRTLNLPQLQAEVDRAGLGVRA